MSWAGVVFFLDGSIAESPSEAHGGSARARSALGQGSVFEILLPLPRTSSGEMAQ